MSLSPGPGQPEGGLARSVVPILEGHAADAELLIRHLEQLQHAQAQLQQRLQQVIDQHHGRSAASSLLATLERSPGEVALPRPSLVTGIGEDARSWMLVLRWVGFLLSRVDRDRLGQVLDHYQRLGWISGRTAEQVLAVAEGEVQEVRWDHIEEQEAMLAASAVGGMAPLEGSEWRLSPKDHAVSLWFVKALAGTSVDADGWKALEREIDIVLRRGSP